MVKRRYELNASTSIPVGLYEYCIDVTITDIPGFVVWGSADSRQRFTVEVLQIPMYIMPDPENQPPFWANSDFDNLPGKVTYFDGDQIDVNFAPADIDTEAFEGTLSVDLDTTNSVPNFLILKNYLKVNDYTIQFKLDLETQPELKDKFWRAIFIANDGELTTEKIINFEFKPLTDELLQAAALEDATNEAIAKV